MFSFFKGKKAASTASALPPEPTFKAKVNQFWGWYTQVAPRFYETIEAKKCSALGPEISTKVDELGPGFAWVFGPGENGNGHSLTVSGEGKLHHQLLTRYWLAQAPKVPGWTFFAARQPCSIRGQRLEMAGRKFDPLEFWLTPVINQAEEKVDITVWHPLFDIMPEQDKWSVLFIFLDDVLGEFGTQSWIGEIKLDSKKLVNSMPLEELTEFIKRVEVEQAWKKIPPGECFTGYRCAEQHSRFLRGDVIAGTTMNPRLVNEYLSAEGDLADPLAGTGADFVFVAFDARILPAGKQVAARGEIEDALDGALKSSASGHSLGGALGKEQAYMDLLLFDGSASMTIVINQLREKKLPAGTSINYFSKEKRGYRRVI